MKKILLTILMLFLISNVFALTNDRAITIDNWNYQGNYADDWTEGDDYGHDAGAGCTGFFDDACVTNMNYGTHAGLPSSWDIIYQNVTTQPSGNYTFVITIGCYADGTDADGLEDATISINYKSGSEYVKNKTYSYYTIFGTCNIGGQTAQRTYNADIPSSFDTIEVIMVHGATPLSGGGEGIGLNYLNLTEHEYYGIDITSPTEDETVTTAGVQLDFVINTTDVDYINMTINSTGTNQDMMNYCYESSGTYICSRLLYGLSSGYHNITILTNDGSESVIFELDIFDAPTNIYLTENNFDYEKINCEFSRNSLSDDYVNQFFQIALFNTSDLDESEYSFIKKLDELKTYVNDSALKYYYDFNLGNDAYEEGTWMCSVIEYQINDEYEIKSSAVGYSNYYYRRASYLEYYLDGVLGGTELQNQWNGDVYVNFSTGYEYDTVVLISVNDEQEEIEGKVITLDEDGHFGYERLSVEYPLSWIYILNPYDGQIIMGRSVPLFMSNDYVTDFLIYNESDEELDSALYHIFENYFSYEVVLSQQGTINVQMFLGNGTISSSFYKSLHLEDYDMMNSSSYKFYVNTEYCYDNFYNYESDYNGLLARVMDYNKNRACSLDTKFESCCFIVPEEFNITLVVWSDIKNNESIGDNHVLYSEVNQEKANEGFIGDEDEEDLTELLASCNRTAFEGDLGILGTHEWFGDLQCGWCKVWKFASKIGYFLLFIAMVWLFSQFKKKMNNL